MKPIKTSHHYYGPPHYPHYRPNPIGALLGFIGGVGTAVAIGSIADANRRYASTPGRSEMLSCNQLDKENIKITSCKKLTDGKVCVFTWKENGDTDACYVKK